MHLHHLKKQYQLMTHIQRRLVDVLVMFALSRLNQGRTPLLARILLTALLCVGLIFLVLQEGLSTPHSVIGSVKRGVGILTALGVTLSFPLLLLLGAGLFAFVLSRVPVAHRQGSLRFEELQADAREFW